MNVRDVFLGAALVAGGILVEASVVGHLSPARTAQAPEVAAAPRYAVGESVGDLVATTIADPDPCPDDCEWVVDIEGHVGTSDAKCIPWCGRHPEKCTAIAAKSKR